MILSSTYVPLIIGHNKYCNELSMTIELDTTLAQAEVLFLSFAQLVADIDRQQAEADGNGLLRRRRPTVGDTSLLEGDGAQASAVEGKVAKIPELSMNLRGLLKAGRGD